MPVISVYVPPELHGRLKLITERGAIARVCREALEAFLASDAATAPKPQSLPSSAPKTTTKKVSTRATILAHPTWSSARIALHLWPHHADQKPYINRVAQMKRRMTHEGAISRPTSVVDVHGNERSAVRLAPSDGFRPVLTKEQTEWLRDNPEE